jgi:hypothetical protein
LNGLNEKSTMRRLQRLIAASVLMALSGAVAGCSGSVSSWDPMDMLDFLDTKKKLQGERKPVFPDGVPGLEQGVPKSLYKGAQDADQQNAQAAAVAAPPPQDQKPKRTAKSRSNQPATASTDPAATPDEDASAAAPPAPKPKKIVRQRTTAPPPDQPTDGQPAAAAQPSQPAQPTQQSAAPFPAPVPGGTFQR